MGVGVVGPRAGARGTQEASARPFCSEHARSKRLETPRTLLRFYDFVLPRFTVLRFLSTCSILSKAFLKTSCISLFLVYLIISQPAGAPPEHRRPRLRSCSPPAAPIQGGFGAETSVPTCPLLPGSPHAGTWWHHGWVESAPPPPQSAHCPGPSRWVCSPSESSGLSWATALPCDQRPSPDSLPVQHSVSCNAV